MITAGGVGRLTRDPEVKQVQSGTILKFTIAVNEKRKDEEITSFFDGVVFGKNADNAARFWKKGSNIQVHGQLRQERWEGQDGKKNSRVVIHVDRWAFIPGARREGEDDRRAESYDHGRKDQGGEYDY